MNRLFLYCALTVIAPLSASAADWPYCGKADTFPTESWQPANASELGWDAGKLADAEALFGSLNSAAAMVVYRGHLIANWGDTAQKFTAQSIRKSLVSSLFGISIDEGNLRLDATLAELGIDDTKPALTSAERLATVRDLLLSRSGIYHPALYETAGMAARRPPRGSHPPDTVAVFSIALSETSLSSTPSWSSVREGSMAPFAMWIPYIADSRLFRIE